jgi:hypothetical protein
MALTHTNIYMCVSLNSKVEINSNKHIKGCKYCTKNWRESSTSPVFCTVFPTRQYGTHTHSHIYMCVCVIKQQGVDKF